MLYFDPTTPVKKLSGVAAATPKLSGKVIASLDLTKSQLAAYAAMVTLGERELDDLTRRQISAAFGVSLGYLNKAIALSTATREAVATAAVTLQDIPTIPTDRVLHKVVADAGVARVWGELEPMI